MKKKIKDLTLVDLTKVKNFSYTPLDFLGEWGVKEILEKFGEEEVEVDE